MSQIIEKLYKQYNLPEALMKKKLNTFEENADIQREFEYWIENGEYIKENPVTIEGYTAESLSNEDEHLNGEAAFLMLIELRDNPNKALQMIKNGFKVM